MAIPEHSAFRLRIGINRRFAATPGEDNYTKQGILWPDMGVGKLFATARGESKDPRIAQIPINVLSGVGQQKSNRPTDRHRPITKPKMALVILAVVGGSLFSTKADPFLEQKFGLLTRERYGRSISRPAIWRAAVSYSPLPNAMSSRIGPCGLYFISQ